MGYNHRFKPNYIWQYKNQDGVSQSEELESFAVAGLVQIDFNKKSTLDGEFSGKEQEIQTDVVLWQAGHHTLAYDLALEINHIN